MVWSANGVKRPRATQDVPTQDIPLRGPEDIFTIKKIGKIGDLQVIKSMISSNFGEYHSCIEELLLNLPLERWRSHRISKLGSSLFRIGGFDIEKNQFLNELIWGTAAHCLMTAVVRASILETKFQRLGVFTRFTQQTFARATDALTTDLCDAAAQNRSAVLVSVHPYRAWIKQAIMSGPMPAVFVWKNASTPADENVRYISTSTSTRGIILQAVKLLRAQATTLFIVPDGPHGGDRMTCKIGHLHLDIGLGAPAIAWFSSADLYFIHTVWTDQGPSLRLVRGPVCQDYSELEEYNAAFSNFYAGELARLIRTEPRSIVGIGTPWRDFRGQAINNDAD